MIRDGRPDLWNIIQKGVHQQFEQKNKGRHYHGKHCIVGQKVWAVDLSIKQSNKRNKFVSMWQGPCLVLETLTSSK